MPNDQGKHKYNFPHPRDVFSPQDLQIWIWFEFHNHSVRQLDNCTWNSHVGPVTLGRWEARSLKAREMTGRLLFKLFGVSYQKFSRLDTLMAVSVTLANQPMMLEPEVQILMLKLFKNQRSKLPKRTRVVNWTRWVYPKTINILKTWLTTYRYRCPWTDSPTVIIDPLKWSYILIEIIWDNLYSTKYIIFTSIFDRIWQNTGSQQW